MEITNYMAGFDIGARSERLVEFERTGLSDWPEHDELFMELEKKAAFFGNVIRAAVDLSVSVQYLGNDLGAKLEFVGPETKARFTEEFMDKITEYSKWVHFNMGAVDNQIDDWIQDDDPEKACRAEVLRSHANVHWLNFAAEDHWKDFVMNGSVGLPPDRPSMSSMQELMGVLGLRNVANRETSLMKSGQTRSSYLKGEAQGRAPHLIEGRVNEFDAGIALAHASMRRQDNRFWVLPAPPQFEYLAGYKNSDYLLMDTIAGRAMGVQVKSSGLSQDRGQPNEFRINLSGRYDLGNSYALPNEERGLGFRDYSYAGRMALSAVAKANRKSWVIRAYLSSSRDRWVLGYARTHGRGILLDKAADRVAYHLEQKI